MNLRELREREAELERRAKPSEADKTELGDVKARLEVLRATTDRSVLLNEVNDSLRVLRAKLVEVHKLVATPPQWRLMFDNGADVLMSSADLDTPSRFRQRVMQAIDERPHTGRGDAFGDVVDMILRAAVPEELDDAATDAGLGREWLASYIRVHARPVPNIGEAFAAKAPWRDGARVVVWGEGLREWLRAKGEKITAARMGAVLRSAGCEKVHERAKVDKAGQSLKPDDAAYADARWADFYGWRVPDEVASEVTP
jgi:hypothetical protein